MTPRPGITWGGFIPDNIHRWIIKECIESGDPANLFRALMDEVDEIEDALQDDDKYWEREAERLGLA